MVLESMSGQRRRVPPAELAQLADETTRFWREWVGRSSYRGRWRIPSETPKPSPD